ncbi:hypothetical protein FQR65_LT05515 [Abscondita terminalis]|nr:hypothetical protein FQR65_LT05515 [Abscondita terminalis]
MVERPRSSLVLNLATNAVYPRSQKENFVQGVGNVLNPVTNLLETVGDVIKENPVKDVLEVVGDVVKDNPVKDLLETVGDVIKENPVKDVLEVVDDVVKDNPVTDLVETVGDVIKDNPLEDVLGVVGDIVKDNPVKDLLETVGDILENPIQNLLDPPNPQQLVCTNIWEVPLVLMINAYLIVRNLFRDVLRSALNLLFSILQLLESLVGIKGLLSIPIKSSVTAEIISKSLKKSDVIEIAVLNIADILSPLKLINNLSNATMLMDGLGNLLKVPLSLTQNVVPIVGGLIGNLKCLTQIPTLIEGGLNILFSFIVKVKNFIFWQILTFKELFSYPYKSFKTAFQKG